MLIAANFHYIREGFPYPYSGIVGVSPAEFGHQLDRLGNDAEFVGVQDIVAALDGEGNLPDKSICITFDDGLREQFELAWPMLERRNIPAVFFINTHPIFSHSVLPVHKLHIVRSRIDTELLARDLDRFFEDNGIQKNKLSADQISEKAAQQYHYDDSDTAQFKFRFNFILDHSEQDAFVTDCFSRYVDEDESETSRNLYMDEDMIRELSQHSAIGSHSHSHLPLARLDPDHADREINRGRELLTGMGASDVVAFSYPYGGIDAVSPSVAGPSCEARLSGGVYYGAGCEREHRRTAAPVQIFVLRSPRGKRAKMGVGRFFRPCADGLVVCEPGGVTKLGGPTFVLMTGDGLRHRHVAATLSKVIDLVGVVVENKRSAVDEAKWSGPAKQENRGKTAPIERHLAERSAKEDIWFPGAGFPSEVPRREIETGTSNDPSVASWISSLSPDGILLFGSGILRDPIMDMFESRVLNMHLGLSPYYRGAGTNFWPFVNREPEYVGVTFHVATSKVDGGPILAQLRPNIDAGDGAHDIGFRAVSAASEVYGEIATLWVADRIEGKEQVTGTGREYKRRDFDESAVLKAEANFTSGMIAEFLDHREERVRAAPILDEWSPA